MAITTHQSKKLSPQSVPKSPAPGLIRKRFSRPGKTSLEPLITPEHLFHELLIMERMRSERFKTSFIVITIDISDLPDRSNPAAAVSAVINAVRNSTRSTDITGWQVTGRSIGILLTDCDNRSIDVILWKLSGKVRQSLSIEQFSFIHFSHIIFPEIAPTGTVDTIDTNAMLYQTGERSNNSCKVSYCLKRLLDITGSLMGIILFSPLFLIIPLIIKCTSGGKVFFRQVRVGQFGEHFILLKFRTMRESNDDSIHREFMRQFIRQSVPDNSAGTYKIKNDPRVTWIGKHLRKTSLDEIPQFFNVLLGNMSLVGPRPAIPYEVDEYALWHRRRVLEVKPGITGFWQVKGRSSTDFETMVRMDLNYIQRWSPALDLKLIFQTPISLITAKGAY